MILFLLGILQGLIGWVMVKSGLNEESLYVNHIRLAIHFISALGLLSYTLWFALQLLVDRSELVHAPALKNFSIWLFALIVVQLIFGAFMAGLKAANFATTWPTINGEWIPSSIANDAWSSLTHDPLAVHFIHRTLAYVIAVLIFIWFQQAKKITSNYLFKLIYWMPMAIVLLQVVLGILTVLLANNASALLWLGVAHQFTAMLLVLVWTTVLYVIRKVK
jgi:cytochrome c oxidase assembly protein subunit 15